MSVDAERIAFGGGEVRPPPEFIDWGFLLLPGGSVLEFVSFDF